jgi:hypothetical protein
VPPSATPRRNAITRPLILGSVESCIKAFEVFVTVSAATPIRTRLPANSQ